MRLHFVVNPGAGGGQSRSRLEAALSEHPLGPARKEPLALSVGGRALVRPGERVFNVGLYNMPAYARGFAPWPEARPGDGRGVAAVAAGRRRVRLDPGVLQVLAPPTAR
jgi:hypothetical protein